MGVRYDKCGESRRDYVVHNRRSSRQDNCGEKDIAAVLTDVPSVISWSLFFFGEN